MSSLLAKLAELLGEDCYQHQMQRGTRREVAFLRDELGSMNALLERLADADAAAPLDPQTREWRDQVREMSYDIEDCVDEYMGQLRRRSGGGGGGVVGLVLSYVGRVREMVSRCGIAEQIQELRARVVEAGHRRKRYKIDAAAASPSGAGVVPVDRRLPALYAELGGLVGVHGPRDELVRLLGDGEERIKVVSVVGAGGLGKTTLANQVYRNIGDRFDCKSFVSLSQNPDIGMIFRTIISQVKKDECELTGSGDLEQLINELRDFLQDKRYLIVIDDIWSTQAWKIIKCAFGENTCGSRIIVTTRIGTVAKSCSSPDCDLVYELKALSEDHSKMLFFRRIFGSEDKCPHQLEEVSVEIVKKCGGLPLAIITMASLLTTKSDTREEWMKAVEDNFVTIVTDKRQVPRMQGKVHRLSSDCTNVENMLTRSSMAVAHVRSLNIFRYSEQMPPLLNFRALRVLDLDGNENLESSYLEDMGKLFQLRYLRIRASNNITLPEQIGELQLLMILDLLNCYGTSELPASIAKLLNLKWLMAHRVTLPNGVGNMQALESLSLVVVDYTTPVTALQEVGSLTKLRSLGLDWRISNAHKGRMTYADSLVSSLGKLGASNLRCLTLISPWSLDFLLESWSPPPHHLQELSIKGWCLRKIPVWMASLANLTYLDIDVDVVQETVEVLASFPVLQFLKSYSNAPDPQERCLVVSNGGFRCLKKLNSVGWTNLMFLEGAMPMLEALEFQIVVHIVRAACGLGSPADLGIRHLSALKNLVVKIYCECARVEEVEALEAAILVSVSMLPNNPTPTLHKFREREMLADDAEQ
ncbi:hypothetical protein ZWY2020_017400 [Hordeum vulgare]|nr:hypothetical protein ZWY2020_017400 [Hordeum vulgare]